ncbi:class I SAM-dependent methyltransferase [Nesterenkonia sp. HG001]|uniref:class I SAM-dependent methyltransferase n=1 Tax=Nesterenkonia sp. HG001 TaxID=2983207 RepID=UPI003A10282A
MGADREPLAEADRISADWLSLREAADAAARESTRAAVAALVAEAAPRTVVDVGCGTGAGGRWLLPLLEGDERWILLDHDSELLASTAHRLAERGARGPVETRQADVGDLDEVLASAGPETLTIASALLDLLTPAQIRGLLEAVGRHHVPLLVALTVTGGMDPSPRHPDDELVSSAFNRHQQRGGRCGPRAAEVLLSAADDLRLPTQTWETPWQLGPQDTALLGQLVRDRAEVAEEQLTAEQDGDAVARVRRWREERLAQRAHGTLHLEIGHLDVLVGRAGLEPATKRL